MTKIITQDRAENYVIFDNDNPFGIVDFDHNAVILFDNSEWRVLGRYCDETRAAEVCDEIVNAFQLGYVQYILPIE